MDSRGRRHARHGGGDDQPAHAPAPGRRTLTASLAPVQRKVAARSASSGARDLDLTPRDAAPAAADPFGLHLDAQAVAQAGLADGHQAMPHAAAIQTAFGHHDIGGITAHVGGTAAAAAAALGAEAYATGSHVAFRAAPDLHTAAHEAAHVIQQRAGVQLKGGMGEVGDRYEQHADAVADRVVRGESAQGLLDEMAGDRASGGASPAIQCYRELPVRGAASPWRLSDNNRILVGLPVNRSKDLFADPALIATANGLLLAAGSYIRLENTGEAKQVKVREGGINATLEDDVLAQAHAKSGGRDDTSRAEMERHYLEANNERLERNDPSGVQERAHAKSGGKHDSTEEEMRQHYFEALEERRREARGTDQTLALMRVAPRISAAAPTKGNVAKLYTRLRNDGGQIKLPSDCNEAARVIMGVGFGPRENTAEVPVTSGGETHGLDDFKLGKEGGISDTSILVERGGLTALRAKLLEFIPIALKNGLGEAAEYLASRHDDIASTGRGYGNAWGVLFELKTRFGGCYQAFVAWSGIDAMATPEVGEALVTYRAEGKVPDEITRTTRLFEAIETILTRILEVEPSKEVLVEAIRLLEQARSIGPHAPYKYLAAMADEVKGLIGAAFSEQRLSEEEGVKLTTEVEDKKLWNKHWGGVVMTDGADYATLENDASTEKHGAENQLWGFALYGSLRPDQSFHEQMLESGDFGNFASTTRFKKP